MPDIDHFRIALLKAKPGDTLVVQVNCHLSRENEAFLENHVAPKVPEGVKLLILGLGMEVKTVRTSRGKTKRKVRR